MHPYTEGFYKDHQEGSRRSAKEIIPLVLQLLQPKSVIDVGCGVGTWLSVFKAVGVEDICGVDGDHIERNTLEIPEEQFLSFDLKKPFRLDRHFDLVVSLEVAEHLPSECAELFVDSLIGLGPVILFSAAIPFQGGTHHVNEQWPDYWATHFQEKGYVVVDCIRKKIWQNDQVEWWYAQNMLIFAKRNYVEGHPFLEQEFENTHTSQLSLVHPRKYLGALDWMQKLYLTVQDLTALIPPGDTFILVDQGWFGSEVAAGRRTIPFLERDGHYWGPPADDITAIQELERLRQSGARFIVFGWPAFWWLDHYSELHRHLCLSFRCILRNDRLVVFDLRR